MSDTMQEFYFPQLSQSIEDANNKDNKSIGDTNVLPIQQKGSESSLEEDDNNDGMGPGTDANALQSRDAPSWHTNATQSSFKRAATPLSRRFMMQMAGLGTCVSCANCSTNVNNNNSNNRDNEPDDVPLEQVDYDLHTLRKQKSSLSPLVVAPMMFLSSPASTTEAILSQYIAACRFYGCPLNSGVLTTFRFCLPSLRVSGSFHDADAASPEWSSQVH
jgi:hypothetical protein